MKDGYSFHANYDSLDATYDEYKAAYERIFTRSGIDYKAITGDGGAMGGKKIAAFMAVTPTYRLGPLGCFRQIRLPLMRSQAVDPRRIKAELLKWMVSGEDTIAYSSESTYAANLKWLLNEYKPSNRVVAEEEVKRGKHQVQSIDEVAVAFSECSRRSYYQDLVYTQMVSLLLPFSVMISSMK